MQRFTPDETNPSNSCQIMAKILLHEAFETMTPHLKEQLDLQPIVFRFNPPPPRAPHFCGVWEREVRSVKTAIKVVLKEQSVAETFLRTVLVEVEGILNAMPLGCVSSDLADPDPITSSFLLMGHSDASLPQDEYDPSNTLGNRWRLVEHFCSRFIRHHPPGPPQYSVSHVAPWKKIIANLWFNTR